MKIKYFIQLALLVFFFGACQKEESTVVNQSPNNIVPNSPLAKLISRTSQNPTSVDDVIDNSSLIKMQLPVTVTVNGNTIPIATPADYQLVQDAKDAFSNDDDEVYCVYPITIQYRNYTTQVINTYSQLHEAIESCGEDDGFHEIDCIAINYPISINIYDTNNQIANTVTIQNNQQLYNFIGTLSSTIAAIVYPISVTDSNGQNVVISSNSQLETFIDNSIDECDDSGSGPSPTFLSILNSGSWYVSYFYKSEDETYHYAGYNFTFINNGTINVVKNSTTTNGSWSNYTDSGKNKLNLSFDNSNLNELDEDWIITEYTPTTIHLKHLSGGGSEIRYLYFTKN